MAKYQLYTFFKKDGTTQLLYGTSAENALDNAEYSTAQVADEIRDFRKGYDQSLEFKNGKWHEKKETKQLKLN